MTALRISRSEQPAGLQAKNESMSRRIEMVSTGDALDHHLKSFVEYHLDGELADYSADAVLFVPTGALKGPDAIKQLFQALIPEFAKPGSSFTMLQRSIEGDHAYIIWTAEIADNSYEFATDTFVVRNGKIVAQSFAAKVNPKRGSGSPPGSIRQAA
jgi:hypothetical protein